MNIVSRHLWGNCSRGIRKSCFWGTVGIISIICFPLIVYPTAGEKLINAMFEFITVKLAWLYILAALGTGAFVLWLSFGPLGNKRLGTTVEYSTFTWVGMLFCAGVGAGLMFGGSIDWAYYMRYPLQGVVPKTHESAMLSSAYGMFHWGPLCWAIYAVLAVPIGYSYYVKKIPILNISQTCNWLLGKKVHGWSGKIIDLLFMTGLVAGSATALGLGIPIVAAGVVSVTGLEHSFTLEFTILLATCMIFSVTSCLGLQKGMGRLSRINVYMIVALFVFVLLAGPTVFLLESAITSIGILASQFISMATWIDPVGKGGFTQNWTVFYYAWFVAYAPFMGLFIAKISRGRTVRQVLLGAIFWASAGCACCYLTFGNYGIYLQLTGQVDMIEAVKHIKGATAIMLIADHLPFATFYKLFFSAVVIVALATTLDAVSFTLAATTTRHLAPETEPALWNRLFWACALGVLPSSILLMNGPLSVLHTASIIAGLPVLCVIVLGVVSFIAEYQQTGWKDSKSDNRI